MKSYKVISQITNFNISDAQTGFRAFTKKVAREIDIRSIIPTRATYFTMGDNYLNKKLYKMGRVI
tara:strand:+ start:243 stop:437 length:195 start_codon:yes stop_codon:yes gene_type:complete